MRDTESRWGGGRGNAFWNRSNGSRGKGAEERGHSVLPNVITSGTRDAAKRYAQKIDP